MKNQPPRSRSRISTFRGETLSENLVIFLMMIWNALKKRDIKIPFPQRVVTVNEERLYRRGYVGRSPSEFQPCRDAAGWPTTIGPQQDRAAENRRLEANASASDHRQSRQSPAHHGQSFRTGSSPGRASRVDCIL